MSDAVCSKSRKEICHNITHLRNESYEAPGAALEFVCDVGPDKVVETVVCICHAQEEYETECADDIEVVEETEARHSDARKDKADGEDPGEVFLDAEDAQEYAARKHP